MSKKMYKMLILITIMACLISPFNMQRAAKAVINRIIPAGAKCFFTRGEIRNCGKPCMRTCAQPDKEGEVCKDCLPGCHCKTGLFKMLNGTCVMRHECPFYGQESEQEYKEPETTTEKVTTLRATILRATTLRVTTVTQQSTVKTPTQTTTDGNQDKMVKMSLEEEEDEESQ